MEKNGRERKLDGATEVGRRLAEMDLTDGRNRGMEKNGRGRKLDGATEAGKRPVEMDLTDGRNRGTERGSSSL
jgi:hypothetical protein